MRMFLAALLSVALLVVMLPRYLGPERAAEPSAQLRVLTANLGMGRADPRALALAGDLNATMDMAPFRRLLDEGYCTATEQAGAGLGRTFPGGRRIPPVLGIDHVLVRNCVAASARTVGLPGSDHLGLLVGVELPLDP